MMIYMLLDITEIFQLCIYTEISAITSDALLTSSSILYTIAYQRLQN